MRSIHALSWVGSVKLYIGAPITIVSAARNSSSTAVSANASSVRCGSGFAGKVAIDELSPPVAAVSWSTIERLMARLALFSPLMLAVDM